MKILKNNIVLPAAPIFLLFLLFSFNSGLFGQGWMKNYPNLVLQVAKTCPDGGFIISGHNGSSELYIAKTDSEGEIQWEKKHIDTSAAVIILGVDLLSDGGYVFAGRRMDYLNGFTSSGYVVKTDLSGNKVWEYSPPFTSSAKEFNEIFETADGGFLLLDDEDHVHKLSENGTLEWSTMFFNDISGLALNTNNTFSIAYRVPLSYRESVATLDLSGNVLWDTEVGVPNHSGYAGDICSTPDGGIISAITLDSIGFSSPKILITKIDSLGVVERHTKIPVSTINIIVLKIDFTPNGEAIVSGIDFDNGNKGFILKVDANGNLLWQRIFDDFAGFNGQDNTLDNGYIVVTNPHQANNYLLKLNGDGYLNSNYIMGQVGIDDNLNCNLDSLELLLENWTVKATDDQQNVFYEITNEQGRYEFNLDSGAYQLELIPPSPIWAICQTQNLIQLSSYDTTSVDLVVDPIVECPYMIVNIGTPLLRRCFENNYYVSYCNAGTIDATGAYIEIDLDPYLTVNSSSIPWSSFNGNKYTFPLGDVALNECGSFSINVTVDCDSTVLGQTHCTEAHIYPDTLCIPPGITWDGSITTVTAACEIDSVELNIKNTGIGDMIAPLNYIVAEDNIILKTGTFELDVNEELPNRYLANGSTYHIYAEQATGYFPPNYTPSAAIEGCGLDPITQIFTIGLLNNLPHGDVRDFLSIDCTENQGSYDPNDKSATPEGVGTDHIIEQNIDLNYRIRFQNTGTDTAFTVVIKDTLTDLLDINTLKVGAFSHPYNLDIVNGNVLKFSFNNILLVDSTTNEPGSHGFIYFKISQKDSLPIGTIINNRAAIFFDFNAPVMTNETYHQIGEIESAIVQTAINNVSEYPELQVTVYPNPFEEATTLHLKGVPEQTKEFRLVDLTGRVIQRVNFNDNQLELSRNNLPTGIYFYSILMNNQILDSGKLILK